MFLARARLPSVQASKNAAGVLEEEARRQQSSRSDQTQTVQRTRVASGCRLGVLVKGQSEDAAGRTDPGTRRLDPIAVQGVCLSVNAVDRAASDIVHGVCFL